MIPALLVTALIVSLFANRYDRAFYFIITLVFGIAVGFAAFAFLGNFNHEEVETTSLPLITENATHVVLEKSGELVSVNRSLLKYADDCEGYKYIREVTDAWIVGFEVPWESYYVSCEGFKE